GAGPARRPPRAMTPGGIAENLERVRERIAEAARRAGRSPAGIVLIGVTKTVSPPRIQEAVDAGLTDLGENKVQEASGKIPSVRAGKTPLTWHMIGHLQRNKARRALELFTWIHSVDSADLAGRLDRLAAGSGIRPRVLVEVNLAGESTKHGVAPADLGGLLEAISPLENLDLAGLMAIPPALAEGAPADAARRYFRELAELRDRWRSRGYDLPVLSMGMTDDFEIAVEEGATHVRVGRAIFGERPPVAAPAA
ncbi:MAG TPA: YggS family pyridoxal phosphate-dependent enzyme, partial [Candidatus Saccharimonadales bacterium]|nr:YggS family pyridoxal phosphate-dependent enzyme [Candidatus Saccharimonadales bacterium]